MSQNNRAFRSNPNSWVNITENLGNLFSCHKITEPSAQIPTLLMNIIIVLSTDEKPSHKITEPSAQIPTRLLKNHQERLEHLRHKINRAFRSNPNCFFLGGQDAEMAEIGHKITEPSAQIPTHHPGQLKFII